MTPAGRTEMEFMYLGLAVMMYFIPAIVAMGKQNKQAAKGVVALNFLLGWTVLGWIGALVWATSLANEQKKAIPEHQKPRAKGLALTVVAMAALTMGNTACDPNDVPVGDEFSVIEQVFNADLTDDHLRVDRLELSVPLLVRVVEDQAAQIAQLIALADQNQDAFDNNRIQFDEAIDYFTLWNRCLRLATWTTDCRDDHGVYPTHYDPTL